MAKRNQMQSMNCSGTGNKPSGTVKRESQNQPKLKKLTFEQAIESCFERHGKLLKKLAE